MLSNFTQAAVFRELLYSVVWCVAFLFRGLNVLTLAMPNWLLRVGTALALSFFSPTLVGVIGAPMEPCRVEVVDAVSGWPVPLVELRTTHQARFVTDNAGLIALDAPDL